MDLESPFLKIAVVRGATGALEEREASKAKIIGDKIELSKSQGGVALFPISDVAGLLPKFPDVGVVYELKDVNEAIRFLEALPEELKQRPDASIAVLQKWKDLKKPAEEADRKRKQEEAEAVAQKAIEEKKAAEEKVKMELDRLGSWFKEAADFQKSRSEEELEKLRVEGQNFLRNKTGDTAKVYDCLAVLSQVLPKEKGGPLPDLAKLSEVQPNIVPDDLLVWVTAGILIASFFGLLMGLSFTSSGVTRLREGAVLGGVVFGGLGLAILTGLAAIWWPMSGDGENISFAISPSMERTIIFAKNSVKPAYYLPSSESKASGLEFASSLLASLPPSADSSGMLKGKLKEGTLWIKADAWMWKQPVTALGIPIPVSFMFQGKIPKAAVWSDVSIEKVSLGRLTLPVSIGSIFCDGMESTIQNGLSSGGFASIKATQMGDGQLLISTQVSGTKPKVEIKEEEKEVVKEVKPDATKAGYRKKITAEELAQEFQKGHGKEFIGKFVLLEGFVERVESGSEVSGAPVASKQVGEKKNKNKDEASLIPQGEFGQNTYDSFYLRTGSKPIRCLIKSKYVFVQDERKDIYLGPSADTIAAEPFIKNGYRVKLLTEGRVEEVNRYGEIEVYGIRLDPELLKEQIQIFDPNEVQKK
jgi:hypothetical protein